MQNDSPPYDIEGLLAPFRESAQFESSGSFSLDFHAAVNKLARFRLAPPELYLLKFIQSGVARHAERIFLETWGPSLVLRCEGAQFSAAELDQLGHSVLEENIPPEQRALRHLAVGLNSALACGNPFVLIESWGNDGQGVAMMVNAQEQKFAPLARRPHKRGTRIILRKAFEQNGFYREEIEHVRENARFCPVPFTLNRLHLERGFGKAALPPLGFLLTSLLRLSDDYVFGQCHKLHHLLEVRWMDSDPEAAAFALPVDNLASLQGTMAESEEEITTSKASAPHSLPNHQIGRCRRALAIEMDLRRGARLGLVHDGVLHQTLYPSWDLFGGVGILSVNHLATDLSSLKTVEGPELTALLEQTHQHFISMSQKLLRSIRLYPDQFPLARWIEGRLGRLPVCS